MRGGEVAADEVESEVEVERDETGQKSAQLVATEQERDPAALHELCLCPSMRDP